MCKYVSSGQEYYFKGSSDPANDQVFRETNTMILIWIPLWSGLD